MSVFRNLAPGYFLPFCGLSYFIVLSHVSVCDPFRVNFCVWSEEGFHLHSFARSNSFVPALFVEKTLLFTICFSIGFFLAMEGFNEFVSK